MSKTIRVSNNSYSKLLEISLITGIPIVKVIENIIGKKSKSDLIEELLNRMRKEV